MKAHTCDVCGRELRSKIRIHGMVLCPKHYNQYKKYGKFLDNNPRTAFDMNEFHICGEITYIDLYNKNLEVAVQAIIDTEDLELVRYTKWRLSAGYARHSDKRHGLSECMSRRILHTDQFVDHINHNTLDNRKCNLRIVTKSQNQMNVNYKGVAKCKNGKYFAHIKLNQKNINLGVYMDEEEALYARWYAEVLLFKEYRYPKEEPQLPEDRKKQIQEYVTKKVQRL